MNKNRIKVTIFKEHGEEDVYNLIVTEEQIRVLDWLCHSADVDLIYERIDEIYITDLT